MHWENKMNIDIIKIKSIILITFISLSCISCANVKTNLYHEEVNIKAKEGKDLVMTFDELERHEKYSIAKVKHTSGAAVASAMFIVKGCYEIAKMRGDLYFANLKEWRDNEGNWLYKIGFSTDDKVDIKTYFGNDIDLKKDISFMSVKEFDRFWGKKK
jgi:hypothetical protein